MSVLDSSALLAFLNNEPGADAVEEALENGAVVSAANWSEIAQKVRLKGDEWLVSSALLDSYDVEVVPVGRVDAEAAALLWQHGSGLSLADRLCIALGTRLGLPILTSDTAWGSASPIEQIR